MKTMIVCCLAVLLCMSPTRAEPPTTAPAGLLAVGGQVKTPLSLDSKTFADMPRAQVRVLDQSGNETTYTGVPLREILQRAGAPVGNNRMRGPSVALYVLAKARDGYCVVYALAEFDADFLERNILLADTRDGQPLSEWEGPLRIIVPDEKKQARWIRQVESIHIESAKTAK